MKLRDCPDKMNCVNSDATESRHAIKGFALSGDDEAWGIVCKLVSTMRGVTIIEETGDYLRATFRIPVFGFIDDLELGRRDDRHVAVRSCSRVGRYDFGVNRRRVEKLRYLLRKTGLID